MEKLHLQAVYHVCQTEHLIAKPFKNILVTSMEKLISTISMLKTGKYKVRFKNCFITVRMESLAQKQER
jgi:hypothetical protein